MQHKILIVDDDRNICEILEFNLINEGYQVECAYSAEEALKKISSEHTLILLDVMMGGISGYKMAEKLRKDNNQIPIIFLTAKDTENDMLTGFSVGADDYISKPFSIKEVIARIKAVIKRIDATEQNTNDNKIIFDDIIIDIMAKELIINQIPVTLTKTEFEILILLAKKPDKIFSRENIIDTVWQDFPYITERTVDVHITRLRKKMGKYASIIVNRPGYGYKFTPSNI
ncbi:MAG: response regulator transcription factor [Bacteroidales bacterium]|jgi:DNA-binding response OmpR family regulator|nr:response regulator transcription factor [Bacteroidales bacterium]